MDIINSFFDGSYMPHGHCYLWRPEILWTHVLSDTLIAASYFSIPIALYYIVKKRDDWHFRGIFILFSAFIFMCGITHIMGIVTIWQGVYGIHGVAKAITAAVSFATAVILLKSTPKILTIPSVDEIENANRVIAEQYFTNTLLQAQQESQRLFSITLDASPIGLLTLNADGIIQVVNRELVSIFGYHSDELVDHSASKLLANKKDEELLSQAFLQNMIDTQGDDFFYLHQEIVWGLTKSGKQVPLEIRLHGEKYNGEHIIFASIANQTERLSAEKNKSYLSAIVESCDDSIIGKTLEGQVTHWNKAAQRLYGYSSHEMIGQSIFKLVPPDLVEEEKGFLHNLKQGKTVQHQETLRLRKDGTSVPVLLTISPIFNSHQEVIGASTIARDITEKKRAEQQMLDYNRALQASNKELEQFAFIASHDLKEPLRKILSFGMLVKNDSDSHLSLQGREFLGYMLEAAERMRSLLECLLDYSRVGTSARQLESVDLNVVIQDVIDDLEIQIKESGAQINSGQLPHIKADRNQVYQLLKNLLENSLKYRQKSQPPSIDISAQAAENYRAKIVFKDNGIGFDQQYAEQIFKMFKRLQGRSEFPGNGIGLAICRKIMERHGGTIHARGKKDQGAEFELNFP